MPTRFLNARPHLEVADVERSISFYERAFGFHVLHSMGEPPVHAIIEKDGVTVTLARVDSPAVASIAACFIDVEGVDELFAHCAAAGFKVASEPTDRPWGIRDLVVVDPDGHLIAFGERID
ncbi:MAG TPA: VOC family protein [Acidimicrobiia bacterium]